MSHIIYDPNYKLNKQQTNQIKTKQKTRLHSYAFVVLYIHKLRTESQTNTSEFFPESEKNK